MEGLIIKYASVKQPVKLGLCLPSSSFIPMAHAHSLRMERNLMGFNNEYLCIIESYLAGRKRITDNIAEEIQRRWNTEECVKLHAVHKETRANMKVRALTEQPCLFVTLQTD